MLDYFCFFERAISLGLILRQHAQPLRPGRGSNPRLRCRVGSELNGAHLETMRQAGPSESQRIHKDSRPDKGWSGNYAAALRPSHRIASQISSSLRPYSCASAFGSSLAAKREAITAVEIPVPSITDFPSAIIGVIEIILGSFGCSL